MNQPRDPHPRRRSRRTRAAARALIALACSTAGLGSLEERALAFDYPEHAHISRHALYLATKGCAPGGEAQCNGAIAMADALKSYLGRGFLCRGSQADANQPPECFTLADIPALNGDHSASPLLTFWRWFDDEVASRQQSQLAIALPGVIAAFNTGRRSPESELARAPDRLGFLHYVRAFAPNRWPIDSGPADLTLEGFDDTYVALAERGHPHFRPRLKPPSAELAAQRRLLTYPQFDPSRQRSKPEDQVFAWYADEHLGALELAAAASKATGDDARLLSAAALLLELSAWHYLEDSVAAGHMIADVSRETGLNNGALTATHNEYCQGTTSRVMVKVPDALCDVVLHGPARAWTAALPDLEVACANRATPLQIFGDHLLEQEGSVAGDGVSAPPVLQSRPGEGDRQDRRWARVTENWAAALAAESFSEVVRASLGEDIEGVPRDVTALGACGRTRPDDPAYTWACTGNQAALYRCLFDWWEGDKPVSVGSSEHAKAIIGAYGCTDPGCMPRPGFRALGLVPVPEPEGPARSYPEETFYSGNSFSVSAFGYEYASKLSSGAASSFRAGADLDYLLAVPRTLAALQIAMGGRFEMGVADPTSPRIALKLGARVFYTRFSRWYWGGAAELGYLFHPNMVVGGGDVIPVGVAWVDAPGWMSTIELRAGGEGYLGWRAGLSASALF